MNTAINIAAELIRRWEGCRLTPYLCPAGIPTIGYGATYYRNGQRVTLLDAPITKDEANTLLIWMIEAVYLPAVIRLCPNADTPGRVAALIDFAFNIGVGALRASTLRKKVNAMQWDEARAQLMRWNKAGGVVLRGLTLRRLDEAALL